MYILNMFDNVAHGLGVSLVYIYMVCHCINVLQTSIHRHHTSSFAVEAGYTAPEDERT